MSIKSKYRIAYLGEGDAYGFIDLTPEEFEVAQRVLDVSNWETPYFDGWCPKVIIEPCIEGDDNWCWEPDSEIDGLFERSMEYGF